ncbi:MAG: hypothetical protein HGB08_03270 [Candidatus Moranbacteria bacterium]|nr:hypothetical protein [Candidatus Moranbacteria bacterium]
MEIKLNLLPQDKKEKISRQRHFMAAIFWEAIILLAVLMAMAFLFGINYVLSLNAETAHESQSNGSDKDKYAVIEKYESEFSEVNSKISDSLSVAADQLYWSNLFVKMSRMVPKGVDIISISTKDYAIILTGEAATRDDLVAFKDVLVSDSCFSNVDLPLADLVSRDNIDFEINLNINKDCLKSNEGILDKK